MIHTKIYGNLDTFKNYYSNAELKKSYRKLNTPSDFAKDNLFYIQEAGTLQSLGNHISKREKLNSYLFLLVKEGHGTVEYGMRTHILSKGHCILIDCSKGYSHQSSKEDPWEIMWVHFGGASLPTYYSNYVVNQDDIAYTTYQQNEYEDIINACLTYMDNKDLMSEYILSKLLTDLITLCIIEIKSKPTDLQLHKMNSVKEYIDKNYKAKLTLSSIAEAFFISKHYLAREYKKAYGVTIGDYICIKRITYAKELLRFTDQSIEKISLECGINDTNYFAKVFKKLEDCSPSEYRKRW